MSNMHPKNQLTAQAKAEMNALTDRVGDVVKNYSTSYANKVTVLMMLSIALAEEAGVTEATFCSHFDWTLALARNSGVIRLRSERSNGKHKPS